MQVNYLFTLAFGSLVVMVEGFYSSTARIERDVNTLRAYRLLPLPILGNCGCFASKATGVIFRGRRNLPEKDEAAAPASSGGVVERKQKNPGGHHVHVDN